MISLTASLACVFGVGAFYVVRKYQCLPCVTGDDDGDDDDSQYSLSEMEDDDYDSCESQVSSSSSSDTEAPRDGNDTRFSFMGTFGRSNCEESFSAASETTSGVDSGVTGSSSQDMPFVWR